MRNRASTTLGAEIRRFRLQTGITLRQFARRAEVSAAHLSDVEHDRRRPSPEALARIAVLLKPAGVTYETLDRLLPSLEPDIQEWVAETPAARQMLRAVRESGRNPQDVLRDIERLLKRRRTRKQ